MSDNPTPKQPQIKRVTSAEMCKRFNEGLYWEKLKSGELTEHILEENISTLLTQEPGRIRSQMVSYRDSENNEIARCHQFLRDDNSVAAFGKPDPKRLFEDGILYRLHKKVKQST